MEMRIDQLAALAPQTIVNQLRHRRGVVRRLRADHHHQRRGPSTECRPERIVKRAARRLCQLVVTHEARRQTVHRSDVGREHGEDRPGDVVFEFLAEADDVDALAEPRRRRDDRHHFVEDPAGLKAGARHRVDFAPALGLGADQMRQGETAREHGLAVLASHREHRGPDQAIAGSVAVDGTDEALLPRPQLQQGTGQRARGHGQGFDEGDDPFGPA